MRDFFFFFKEIDNQGSEWDTPIFTQSFLPQNENPPECPTCLEVYTTKYILANWSDLCPHMSTFL